MLKYICDNCKKEFGYYRDPNSDAGPPDEYLNWILLDIEAYPEKAQPQFQCLMEEMQIDDLIGHHFCSLKCFAEFLLKKGKS